MEIKIIEEYEGEFLEKKEELRKAMFPGQKSAETIDIQIKPPKERSYKKLMKEFEKDDRIIKSTSSSKLSLSI